jgi:O-antigen biosynthesis protein
MQHFYYPRVSLDGSMSHDLGGFITPAALRSPSLISALSAWNEHIPFAGWIVEALRPRTVVELGVHTGVSYFAFCEAVLRSNIEARCFAVDHWRGDKHSGPYGEEVFESVSRINSEHYASFSRLLRMTFDDALADFEPGQIDLLHIDGLHTYEAVKRDFENWLPKMSESGVVLLHDTAERKSDFGVYRLVAELEERYRLFEFTHGHGLGVVAVGRKVPSRIASLVDLDPDSSEARVVRDLYSSLGHRLALQVRLSEMEVTEPWNPKQILRAEEVPEVDIERRVEGAGEIASLSAAMASQQRELESVQERSEAQGRIIAELRNDIAQLQQQIKNIHESTSWRLTKPVRFAGDKARSLAWRLRRDETTEPIDGIRRLYQSFDPKLDRETRRRLRAHLKAQPHLRETLVSIVMPTFDRGYVIGRAIESVRRQTHETWELLVIDDGSTDDTESVIDSIGDDRIRYVKMTNRSGVGVARNEGLKIARGDLVSYLDSDNTWDREFLALMVSGLDMSGTSIAYSATALIEDRKTVGYRGDRFDFERCLDANYIDINSFAHRRELLRTGAAFDPKIRRTNDWDFILRITFGAEVGYFPFIGVKYSVGERPDQITLQEPYVFRNIVEARHRRRFEGDLAELESFEQVLDQLPLGFAIRIAAPLESRSQWGDHHFAVGLANALERLGHKADVHHNEEELRNKYDVVLVLRGLTQYPPTQDAMNAIWSISHPDQLGFDELEGFDLVFTSSMSYRAMLSHIIGGRALPLLQATDRDRFFPHPDVERGTALLFVGNSRKVDRPTVRYALEAGLPIVIHGSGWDGMAPHSAIRSTYLPNEEASIAYARAGAVLNDHWQSMKDFGFISNRVFDAVASGATVISDSFPELKRVFGGEVHTFSTKSDFIDVAHRALTSRPDKDAQMNAAMEVLDHHTLDARAKAIVHSVHAYLGKEHSPVEDPAARTRVMRLHGIPGNGLPAMRVGIVPQMPNPGRMSSSAYIRLIQPLTSDLEDGSVDLSVIDPESLEDIERHELVVVSRTALSNIADAESLIARTDGGARLAVDIDDAFHLMDESHPQFDEYRGPITTLTRLLDAAAMVWCSTDALRDSLDPSHSKKATVVPNTIDPRLWRRYRKGLHSARSGGRLELLYMGTSTHAPDLEMILPSLERLASEHPEAFRLTVIGLIQTGPDPSWIRRIPTPYRSEYPHFARWLRDQAGEFDVGIAPLVDSVFNRLKSDIKVLEYTALGLPSIASSVGPYRALETVDLCESQDEWYKSLATLFTDGTNLDERRIQIEHVESAMWRDRRSAIAGESMVRMASQNARH